MLAQIIRNHKSTLLATLAALCLALGWAVRERAHADEKARLLTSQTLTAADVKTEEATYQGKPTGKAAAYFKGDTAGTRSFLTGRFVLNTGTEPHPPHRHVEEEILIVASGTGEIVCAGKTTEVGAGSMMYTAPNVEHGIRNTGKDPMVFYFIKWTGTSR